MSRKKDIDTVRVPLPYLFDLPLLWVDAADLLNYDWAEADVPIVREYLNVFE